jgi:hypothetical protein
MYSGVKPLQRTADLIQHYTDIMIEEPQRMKISKYNQFFDEINRQCHSYACSEDELDD